MIVRHRPRQAGPSTLDIQETLSAAPNVLPSDPEERASLLKRKLQTGNPVWMAEVVRDLAWRQRRGRATKKDVRLLRRADRQLTRQLAAQTGAERGRTRRRMWGTVERTISLHI
jgi:RNA polymerase-interacting CarD/CdnL/TRCF family regulator